MEKVFDCETYLNKLGNEVADNSIDIHTIFTYLIEETDFADWINNQNDYDEDCDCDGNCEECEYSVRDDEYEESEERAKNLPFIMLKEEYDIQSEKINKLNGELIALQKRYRHLEKKYKELKSSN